MNYSDTWKTAIIPTDTVYGVVSRANDREAIERIYKIKNREAHKACLILLPNIRDINNWHLELPGNFEEIVTKYWPGPVTLIFGIKHKALEELHYLHRGTNALAFRVPDDPQLRSFLAEYGPVIAPSANPAGQLPATTSDQAREYFGNTIDMYIDGGERNNKPSTIISFVDGDEKIIRE